MSTPPANPTDARFGAAATFERLKQIRPREAKFPFVDNDDVLAAHHAAKRRLDAAEEARRKRIDRLLPLVKDTGDGDVLARAADLLDAPDPDVDAARAKFEEAERAVVEATSHIVFHSLGRPAYDALLSEHPPTKEQKEALGLDLDHNPQTFPLALIAACAAEPRLTVEQIEELHEGNVLNGADVQAMFNTCVLLCTTRRTASVGKG